MKSVPYSNNIPFGGTRSLCCYRHVMKPWLSSFNIKSSLVSLQKIKMKYKIVSFFSGSKVIKHVVGNRTYDAPDSQFPWVAFITVPHLAEHTLCDFHNLTNC